MQPGRCQSGVMNVEELSEFCGVLASSVVSGSDIPGDAAQRFRALSLNLVAVRCFACPAFAEVPRVRC